MSLKSLKSEMLELIELSAIIARYHEMLRYHNNPEDQFNYNPEKSDVISTKLSESQKRFNHLRDKWFSQ